MKILAVKEIDKSCDFTELPSYAWCNSEQNHNVYTELNNKKEKTYPQKNGIFECSLVFAQKIRKKLKKNDDSDR